MKSYPTTPEQILDVIVRAERSRRFAWTAGRVVKKCALSAAFRELEFIQKKLILKRITEGLEILAERGLLVRREERQSIGFGNEIGFDYRLAPHPLPARPKIFEDAEAFLKTPCPDLPGSPPQ